MSHPTPLVSQRPIQTLIKAALHACVLVGMFSTAHAQTQVLTPLSDQPVFASSEVPGNLALSLSVEWPTASRTAHVDQYNSANAFLGYFDPEKCYEYIADTTEVTSPGGTKVDVGKGDHSYFNPTRKATSRKCNKNNEWSGNFLNWATLTTIDPFRWAMTGGRRVIDEVGNTIIEKGWQSGQGLFPDRNLPSGEISGASPYSNAKTLKIQINGRGYAMRIFYTDANGKNERTADFTVRVKVCDPKIGVEANCVAYGENNWKPEGLIQQYSNKMRFSAFGYMNHTGNSRDGGVLRARQKFVGPTYPRPGDTPETNANAEWNPNTGLMIRNPDIKDAADTSTWASLDGGDRIQDSGVMNYLNKFGQVILGSYKGNDPVNELYYATLRYYRGLDNIDAWTNLGNASTANKRTYLDGFPVIRDWTKEDPIQHSCQRNFVLGIGDIYTHSDKNVPGGSGDSSPSMPTFNDPVFDAGKSLTNLKKLQNYTQGGAGKDEGANSSADFMAGLAFEANTLDIRPDDIDKRQTIGKQTVQTYWVDVLEQSFSRNNKFYLAAKFGGLNQSKLPTGFDPYTYNGAIPLDWWSTSGDKLKDTRDNSTWDRPDNYFTAGKPDDMVSGLQKAFQSIANEIRAYTTSFSYTSADVISGDLAYASQYDSNGWTGAVSARKINYDAATGQSTTAEVWSSDTKLTQQIADTGWDTNRRIVTWKTNSAVPFRHDQLTTEQKNRLNTSYVTGNDSQNYLNYLRGQRLHEQSSTTAGSTRSYRTRNAPLGDIVNSKVTAVGAPSAILRDAQNAGYSDFKLAYHTRPTMVYVGANDGMLHAFNGSGTGTNAGAEVFAYIPTDMFNLTYSQSGTTGQDGPDSILGGLGNPNYQHRYSVDATPLAFDVDFNHTHNSTVTTPDWRTILIGGLGKGGRSFYAIDVTNPAAMTTESAVASKVLWEFTDSTMGFSFGSPIVVKTAKYGWVVLLTSGYNNSDGYGYLYVLNPKNGALLQKIKTSATAPGMAYASAYVQDFSEGTTDSAYAGDLNGNVWRFDLTGNDSSVAYPAGQRIAQLKDSQNNNLAITTAPLIEVHPDTRFRYILIGTGKLLDLVDVSSSQEQSFFAIKDGTAGAFKTHTSLITRASLREVTDLTTGLPLDTSDEGWFIDLGIDEASGIGWRMIATPVAASDVVAFTTMLTIGDACSPAGVSRVYALNFLGGKTALMSGSPYVDFLASITDIRLLTIDGKIRLIAGDNQGNIESIDIKIGIGSSLRILNWRETFSFD